MNNIFKNARFGKSYKTRGEQEAIYQTILNGVHILFTETMKIGCTDDGRSTTYGHQFDIISELEEEINEEELNKLAKETFPDDDEDEDAFCANLFKHTIRNAFKAGFHARGCYCKAKNYERRNSQSL